MQFRRLWKKLGVKNLLNDTVSVVRAGFLARIFV